MTTIPPVQIFMVPDGIWIVHNTSPADGVFRELGQYWLAGAVDRDQYPYEVMITVVRRFNEPTGVGKVPRVVQDTDRG